MMQIVQGFSGKTLRGYVFLSASLKKSLLIEKKTHPQIVLFLKVFLFLFVNSKIWSNTNCNNKKKRNIAHGFT